MNMEGQCHQQGGQSQPGGRFLSARRKGGTIPYYTEGDCVTGMAFRTHIQDDDIWPEIKSLGGSNSGWLISVFGLKYSKRWDMVKCI